MNDLTPKSNAHIAITLCRLINFRGLKVLNLSGNRLSPEAATFLAKLLGHQEPGEALGPMVQHPELFADKKCMVRLESLSLNNCIFSPVVARRIFAGLLANESLKELDLSGNSFGQVNHQYGSTLGRLLCRHPGLRHVDLRHCNLTELEILYICRCMRASETLTSVHLGYNCLTNFGRMLARNVMNAKVKRPF